MKKNLHRGIAPLVIMLIIAAVVATGGGVVIAKKNKAAAQAQANANMNASSSAKTINFDLKEQNNSGQSGHVTITEVNGKAKVIVTLTGKPSDISQPSHIHLGSCSTIGVVKYPLTNVDKGSAQTMLDISLDQLVTQLSLSLNVHKSAAEMGVYVACGDINTSTGVLKGDKNINVNANINTNINAAIATTSTSTKVEVNAGVDLKVR